MEVGEHTPRLFCSLSLLFSHGVLSLLGNTEVYCSVLVSRLSLSLSLTPPFLSYSPPLSVHKPYTSVRLTPLCISSFPTLSPASLSSLHLYLAPPMGICIATACTVHSGLCHDSASLWRTRLPCWMGFHLTTAVRLMSSLLTAITMKNQPTQVNSGLQSIIFSFHTS